MIDPAARARLEWWKLSLLDLSSGTSLLDAGRTWISLPEVEAVPVAETLAPGGALALAADGRPDLEAGRLVAALPASELATRLAELARATRGPLVDRGVHTLWLGLGTLVWCEATQASHAAPLALWPVDLERTESGELRLVGAEGVEPQPNHVLAEKLRRDLDLLLPLPPAGRRFDGAALAALLEAVEGLVLTRPGWRVDRAVRLGAASLEGFALWRDLEERGDAVLAAPVVAHLALGGPTSFAQPSAGAAGAVTAAPGTATWTADLLAPLDADAAQLQAVAAASAGASFVLQAPPGTGASQTIANLVATCAAQGKSVLVVSDKLAVLDVVQQRLAAIGLPELGLELYGKQAQPARVLAQLGRVLDRAFRPGSGPIGDGRLADLRGVLDDHATALHRIGPFGRSVHEVLGRLVELRTTPRAALADGDSIGLDGATFERRHAAVRALADAAVAVEPVASHPWRASRLANPDADGLVDRARVALDEAAEAVATLAVAVREVMTLVPGLVARTRDQLQALGTLAALAAVSPRPGGELLTHLRSARADELGEQLALIRARGGGSIEVPRDPLAFLQLASRHRQLADEVRASFAEAVLEDDALDAAALWSQLRKWTHSMAPLRFVALRTARAEVRAAALPGALESDAAMIEALEAVIAERACRVALAAAAEPARRWFGELGGDPARPIHALELGKLDAAVAWAAELRRAFDAVEVAFGDPGRNTAWRALVAQVAASPTGSVGELAPFARLADAVARWMPALVVLAEATGIDAVELAAVGEANDHLIALRERVATLRHAIDGLHPWVGYARARHAALASGVATAVKALERGDLGAVELAGAWERATLLAWVDAEIAATEPLASFHGASLHAHVAAFADLDRAALALVRSRVLVRVAERVPMRPLGTDPGELGLLLEELGKARAGRELGSVRATLASLPTLLPRIVPAVLATPQTVAQLLDPALPRFDLVVIDGASRIATSEAIVALSRGGAAVVVGDSRQLPPARAPESVLEDCLAARLPELRLAWQYRCRHEDTIAFANERYYEDRMQVLPASQPSPDLGIAWRHVDGDVVAEADAVVAEVGARLRDPAQAARSIAIVTLSPAHRDRIEERLDAAGLGTAGDEPLVVKTVDDIQGEVRDVVIVALGSGPDAPLVADELGRRRLAVALTRAREQVVVVSTFSPDEVVAPELGDLAALLAFARAGGGAARPVSDEPASPITAAIARALVERGWIVRHQVGCGAYKLDLAIVDPNDPERYVLAIEHDGPAYASARSARDRDRLRPQVLAGLGWRVHRIWSLDWWADPEREIQRAHAAIVTAIAAGRQRRAPTAAAPRPSPLRYERRARASSAALVAREPSGPVAKPTVTDPGSAPVGAPTGAPIEPLDGATLPTLAAGSAPVRIARNTIPIGPYVAAAIPPGRRTPDDLFAARHLAELGKVVEQVLAAEAPMHVGLLARRVGAYFGIGRVTQRVTDQIRVALEGRGKLGDEQDVVWRLDQDPAQVPPVRVAGGSPTGKREIDQVPLSELASAARIVVERAAGISTNDLVRDAARLLGFARITDDVKARVAQGVRLAQVRELIRIDGGKAQLPVD